MSRGLLKKKTILELIGKDPGIGFLEIHKNTGFGHGVLSHHLKTLEKEGSIKIKRVKRKMWAFHSSVDPNDYNIRIFLRKETCKKIITFLFENKRGSFQEIRESIGKSPSTVSLALKILVENDLVRTIHGFPKSYSLENYEKTAQMIASMRISHTDLLKDRFADTFSYL